MTVHTRPYDLPLSRPYRWAGGTQSRRAGLWVHIQGDGPTGLGEVAPPPHQPIPADILAHQVAESLHGCDPMDQDFLDQVDARRPDARVRCGISTAWWDLQARLLGVSMATCLARHMDWPESPLDPVPVNALIGAVTALEAAQQAKAAVASGFTTLKVKLDGDHDGNMQRLAAVRDAAPRAELRGDANASWGDDAAERLMAMQGFGLAYVEQPVPPQRRDLLRTLTGGPVPIALDESACDADTIGDLLDDGIGDVVILKPQRLGGPDRTLAAMQVAYDQDVAAVVTNSLETSIGVHAALQVASLGRRPVQACGLATSGWLAQDVAPPPTIHDGHMALPTGAGIGIEVSP